MSSNVANRPTRKASNEDIIKYNSLGFSLKTQGKILGMHPTTITLRLGKLNVAPADTRRAFMEDILERMPNVQVEWLADQLGPHHSIKDYVHNLLTKEFLKTQTKEADND